MISTLTTAVKELFDHRHTEICVLVLILSNFPTNHAHFFTTPLCSFYICPEPVGRPATSDLQGLPAVIPRSYNSRVLGHLDSYGKGAECRALLVQNHVHFSLSVNVI